MFATNALFLLLLLAFALDRPRSMEWLSASFVAWVLALLAAAIEPCLYGLSHAAEPTMYEKAFGLWFGIWWLVCARTIGGDAWASTVRRFPRLLGRFAQTA